MKKNQHSLGAVQKSVYTISFFILLLAVIVLSISLFWALTPTNTLEIKNNPVPVEKAKVNNGDVQIVDISYCKNSNIKGYVTWQLISSRNVIVLPPYQDMTVEGCNSDLRAPLILPYVVYTDQYYFHWTITYQVNPLRATTTEFNSQKFILVGNKTDGTIIK